MAYRAGISRRGFLGSMALFVATSSVEAQDAPTFSTNVKVISVLANVRDKHGAIIRNLTKGDFTLLEDGRPQAISYFTQQSDLPLTLGLLVDTSMSQERVLDAERAASFRFLDAILRDNKDHDFVLQFDLTVLVRVGLTSSFAKLNDGLSEVQTPTRDDLKNQTGG